MKKGFYFFLLLLAMPLLFSTYVGPAIRGTDNQRGYAPDTTRGAVNALLSPTSIYNYVEDSCIVFNLEDFNQVSAWQVNGYYRCTFTPDELITKVFKIGGKDGMLMRFTYYDFDLHARVVNPSLPDNMAITVAYYAWQYGYQYEYNEHLRLHLLHLVKIQD